MAKRTLDKDSLLPKAWKEFAKDPFNLHNALTSVTLDSLFWEDIGGTTYCVQKNAATKEQTLATFICYGRFRGGMTSFKLTADAGYSGMFPVAKTKATAELGKAWESDAIDAIDLAASWPVVLNNAAAVLNTRNREKTDNFTVINIIKDGTIQLSHKLFMDKSEFQKAREVEYDADDIYKPVDTSCNASLELDGWPWPPNSKIPERLEEIKKLDLVVSPLPAYYYRGDLLLPNDWVKMRGALVVVHFTISWSRIGKEKKSVFTADIQRIDFLERPLSFSPTKRVRASSPPVSPTASNATMS